MAAENISFNVLKHVLVPEHHLLSEEEAEAVLDRVLIAFLLALGVLLLGWGGSFTLLLVALWLLATEQEGKKGRNRSCQGLQERVKWFLHSK